MRKIEEIFKEKYENSVEVKVMSKEDMEYMEYIQVFINLNKIKSVTDIGCGSFNVMRNLDWKKTKYFGVDCVKDIVKINNKKYSGGNVSFKYKEISKHVFEYSEMFIIKDVLNYLSNEIIYNFLDYITMEKLCKYILIISPCDQKEDDIDIIEIGKNRDLNGMFYPLKKYNPIIIKEFKNSKKQVNLIKV